MAIAVLVALVAVACGGDDDADAGRLCDVDADIRALRQTLDAAPEEATEPQEARELVAQIRELLDEADEVAPPDVQETVETVTDGTRVLMEFVEDADFDVSQIPEPDEAQLAEIEAWRGAMGEFEAWMTDNCPS